MLPPCRTTAARSARSTFLDLRHHRRRARPHPRADHFDVIHLQPPVDQVGRPAERSAHKAACRRARAGRRGPDRDRWRRLPARPAIQPERRRARRWPLRRGPQAPSMPLVSSVMTLPSRSFSRSAPLLTSTMSSLDWSMSYAASYAWLRVSNVATMTSLAMLFLLASRPQHPESLPPTVGERHRLGRAPVPSSASHCNSCRAPSEVPDRERAPEERGPVRLTRVARDWPAHCAVRGRHRAEPVGEQHWQGGAGLDGRRRRCARQS